MTFERMNQPYCPPDVGGVGGPHPAPRKNFFSRPYLILVQILDFRSEMIPAPLEVIFPR
ncbi:hypothetical protein MiTa_00170 [Microcystis aeruginosa NIES-4264]|nr:hypothetical protein MiTa_00170 [Microcystis aeruginosa NIES-4264]